MKHTIDKITTADRLFVYKHSNVLRIHQLASVYLYKAQHSQEKQVMARSPQRKEN